MTRGRHHGETAAMTAHRFQRKVNEVDAQIEPRAISAPQTVVLEVGQQCEGAGASSLQ